MIVHTRTIVVFCTRVRFYACLVPLVLPAASVLRQGLCLSAALPCKALVSCMYAVHSVHQCQLSSIANCEGRCIAACNPFRTCSQRHAVPPPSAIPQPARGYAATQRVNPSSTFCSSPPAAPQPLPQRPPPPTRTLTPPPCAPPAATPPGPPTTTHTAPPAPPPTLPPPSTSPKQRSSAEVWHAHSRLCCRRRLLRCPAGHPVGPQQVHHLILRVCGLQNTQAAPHSTRRRRPGAARTGGRCARRVLGVWVSVRVGSSGAS